MRFASRHFRVLCVSVLLGSGCATQTQTITEETEEWSPAKRADVHAQLAAQYLERNVLKTANEELQRALSIDPNHSRSNYVMAVLQTRLKDYKKADSYYRRALKSNPNNAEAAHDYGIFLCQEGKVERALQYFEQALANPLYNGDVLTNVRAGECLMTAAVDPVRAEGYFKTALKASPNIPAALYYMADISYRKKNYLSARGFIERFFSINEETPQSLLLATKIESGLRADDAASDYARRLRAKFPASEEAKQVMGIL